MPRRNSIIRSPKDKPTGWSLACLFALTLATLAILISLFGIGPYDDAFIFFRYAKNLADGRGPVFNVGERVEGFSSPLWTLMLAGPALLGVGVEVVALVFGTIFMALTIVMVPILGTVRDAGHRSHRSHSNGNETQPFVYVFPGMQWRDDADRKRGWRVSRRALAGGLGLAGMPICYFAAGSGMDGPLFACIVMAAMLSLEQDRDRGALSFRSTLLLISGTFARTEGALLALYVGGFFLIQRHSIRMLTWYLLVIAGALFARYAYYGSWVPNTAHAKITFDLQDRFVNGFVYLGRASWVLAPALAATAVVVFLAIKHGAANLGRHAFLLGWVILYVAYTVYVGGDNLPALRFLLPVLPVAASLYMRLVIEAGKFGSHRLKKRMILASFSAILATNVLTHRAYAPGYYGDMELVEAWRNVGRWLADHTSQDAVIATPVPGAMGFESDRLTIDMLGLTDQTVAMQGKVYPQGAHGHARYHTDYIFDRAPDLVVYMSSGRFEKPHCRTPDRIDRFSGNALYDFVVDPRCQERYEYQTATLENGKIIEMQRKRSSTSQANAPVSASQSSG